MQGEIVIKAADGWVKVVDVIKAQIVGQSAFAFDSANYYPMQIQGTDSKLCKLTERTGLPTDNAGFNMQMFEYYPDSDATKELYIKCNKDTIIYINEEVQSA